MKKFIMVCILLCGFTGNVWAAVPEDFAYCTLRLGDSYQQMVEALGTTRVDIDKTMEGRLVTYYFYQDTRIGIDKRENRIVDMRIADKAYTAKNGVKVGATQHKILQEYGKTTRQQHNRQIFYIYENPQNAQEKLMFNITEGYLEEIRITSLTE